MTGTYHKHKFIMEQKNKPTGGTAGALSDNQNSESMDKYTSIPQVSGSLSEAAQEDTPQPMPTQQTPKEDALKNRLLTSFTAIINAAANDIVWTPAWVSLNGAPIMSKGTINVIQGKAGVHKSRFAETLCSLLLSPHGKGDYLGFERYNLGAGYYVGYVDTERNTQEHFPAAVQRIRERAGIDKKANNGRFYPVSIKQEERRERLAAVKEWIEFVRGTMAQKGVQAWNLFVVLDVVTDCVQSFNRDDETMALFDYLGNLCEHFGVTFLLVLHENPFSEKARGHTGTEAMNKADTQMQISYEAGSNGEETDLIKIKFLKTRNAARPQPLYLQYSKERNGLVTADPDTVNEHIEIKRKTKDEGLLIERLQYLFDSRDDIPQKDIIADLEENLSWSKNTITGKLDLLVKRETPILNKAGLRCRLAKQSSPGKPSVYSLEVPETETKATAKRGDEYTGEDAPF